MENRYVAYAEELLRNPSGNAFYNCAQVTLMSFAEEGDADPTALCRIAAHFGGGMKMGATCGAITGGLMAIGLLGGGDAEYRTFMQAMRRNHGNMTNCADLLRESAKNGIPKKTHCEAMMLQAVEQVAQVMKLEA